MSTITQTVLRRATALVVDPTGSPPTTITVNGRFVRRVPSAKPSFTLADIRRAVPAHCFEHSLVTSFGYVAYDLAIVVSLGYLAMQIDTLVPAARFGGPLAFLIRHVLWVAYWVCQGSVMTGIWILGHECGHGGFAKSSLVNDVTGFILHSAVLVPYFSWQISHRKHHGNTGSLEHDEVFVPQVAPAGYVPDIEDKSLVGQLSSSLYRCVRIVLMLTVGWPLYLFTNATGNSSYPKNSWVNHFTPNSPIYADIRNGPTLIILSDIGVLIALGVIAWFTSVVGFANVFYYYIVPYLVTNLFLVLITFLQHTDQSLPHYDHQQWDWLRGALLTMDRDYGVLNSVFHHISDTHVVHHLFSYMPFYHAVEATEAVKPLLGDYYLFDDTPIWTALWRSYGECRHVIPDKKTPGVYWF